MFTCPACRRSLTRVKTELGVLWSCDRCEGRALTVSMMRNHIQREFVNSMWQRVVTAKDNQRRKDRMCPSCSHPMVIINDRGITGPLQLDACRVCQFIWFDKDEPADLPIKPNPTKMKVERSTHATPIKPASSRPVETWIDNATNAHDLYEVSRPFWDALKRLMGNG